MYINSQQNRVSRSVRTCTQIYLQKNYKVHKFATTNSSFEEIDYLRHSSS